MANPVGSIRPSVGTRHPRSVRAAALLLLLAVFGATRPARAELQFDVFLGYDDRIREGHWFPAAFEIFNDGPAFNATVVLGPDGAVGSQPRSFAIELPTGTRKRVVIPAFSSSGRYARWEAQLIDANDKVVAERSGLQPKDTAPHIPILGALPRTFGGLPTFPEVKSRAAEFAPSVARLQSEYFPANPIALEGLTACYLNSEKAADLKPEQVDALLAWLHQGGHLIVGIEQPGDVTTLPWLRGVLPFAPSAVTNRFIEGSFERWLVSGRRVLQLPTVLRRNPPARRAGQPRSGRVTVQTPAEAPQGPFATITPQNDFNSAEVPLVAGRATDGETILGLGDLPLIVSAARGHGTVTALAFSPEREPFRGWKNRSWFWAKLVSVPEELLVESETIRWGGPSIDALFGAMLDSRQVRKLPVAALLLLLVVYLAVIGPFDQWILKRTGKQMWTWVTFPVYVVLFSGLIYFIGYRLRAGDLEWNELQVVDQLPRAEGAALRGRTWVSVYSPENARYRVVSDQPFATFRAESQGGTGRGESGRITLRHPARGFEAEASVPVWISQLFASDWLEAGPVLLAGQVTTHGSTATVTIENPSTLRVGEARIAFGGRLYPLGEIGPGQKIERQFDLSEGVSLDDFTGGVADAMNRVEQRRQAFGSEGSGWLDRNLEGVILASLTERAARIGSTTGNTFTSPAGFDIDTLIERGQAVLFAWAPGQSLAPPIHRFSPTRLSRDAVLRIALPVRTTR
jgi:hypothetical protein